jgi:NADH dehydrogenase (ubiquinone) 1 alpha/beta subcomplex 1
MALSSTLQALRSGLLRQFRVPIQQAYVAGNGSAAVSLNIWRGFAGGGYLDKTEVTDRIINVTKHFEKIDPAKVRPTQRFHTWVAGRASLIGSICLSLR